MVQPAACMMENNCLLHSDDVLDDYGLGIVHHLHSVGQGKPQCVQRADWLRSTPEDGVVEVSVVSAVTA